ncbi:MAG: LysE family translocator [Tepidisphaerales bacterium]
MFAAIGKGILLGLGAAAPIGPVNVEIARRTLRGGFPAGFFLGLGAVTVDVSYAILVSLSIRPVLDTPWLVTVLTFAGSTLLGYLSWLCLRDFAKDADPDLSPEKTAIHRGYVTGLLMTSLNPMTLVFWFVAVPGQAANLRDPARELPLLSTGVFLGAISWVFFFTGLVSAIGGIAKHRAMRLANLAGGAMLAGFALYAIWQWAAKTLSYAP